MKRRALIPWMFLAPSLSCVCMFVLIPFADAVRRSFFSAMSGEFQGFRNYQVIFQNESFQLASWNTFRFTAICVPLVLVLSLLLAVLLFSCGGKDFLKTSFLIPMAIPAAAIALLWQALFQENGLLSSLLGRSENWLDSGWAYLLLAGSYLWKNVGYAMVLWLAGLNSIPVSLYEAAMADGAGALRRFYYITLPCLAPTFYTVAVICLVNSFKVFREAYLIAGDYPHDCIYLLQHLFNNWFLTLDIDRLCAAATVMTAAVLPVILLLQHRFGREEA